MYIIWQRYRSTFYEFVILQTLYIGNKLKNLIFFIYLFLLFNWTIQLNVKSIEVSDSTFSTLIITFVVPTRRTNSTIFTCDTNQLYIDL